MPSQLPDLWPEDIGVSSVVAPLTVLRDQAAKLGPRTQNAVQAVVETTAECNQFVHTFFIVVPSAPTCRYRLLRVKHGLLFYPLEVTSDLSLPNFRAGTQEEFLRALGEIFASGPAKKIIHSLIAQSRAA